MLTFKIEERANVSNFFRPFFLVIRSSSSKMLPNQLKLKQNYNKILFYNYLVHLKSEWILNLIGFFLFISSYQYEMWRCAALSVCITKFAV